MTRPSKKQPSDSASTGELGRIYDPSEDRVQRQLERLGDFGLKKLSLAERRFAGKLTAIEITFFVLAVGSLFTNELSFHQRIGIGAAACAIVIWRLIPNRANHRQAGTDFLLIFMFLILAALGALLDTLENLLGTALAFVIFVGAYVLLLSMAIQRITYGDPESRE